jgi:hypothetical protein
MGYLNNSIVTVDAVLTKKGRELLAKGDGSFKITQFALADDEIDYTLYNPTHPSGSEYYGEAIERTPLLEAFVDETQTMKYKLATLPRGTSKLPVLDLGYTSIVLKQGSSLAITPQTLNYLGVTQVFESSGYTATIADVRVLSSFTGVGINTAEVVAANAEQVAGTSVSRTVIGSTINLVATAVNDMYVETGQTQLLTSLTVVGRDSGARLTIPVRILKASL